MNKGLTLVPWVFRLLGLALLFGCQTTQNKTPYGILEEHAGFVPARIAVFPCQTWPNGAHYKSLPLTNVKGVELQEVCNRFDDYVISGFKDQPYMRGFSPKWVNQYLSEANFSNATEEIAKLWHHQGEDCKDCETPTAFYLTSIDPRPDWRLWLKRASEAVKNADAVLMPFVLYTYESTYIDRGLRVAKREVALTMLLIDTDSGHLIWSGGREGNATAQRLASTNVEQPLPYPLWDEVFERVFVEDLWREFPGRQFFK